MEESKGAPEVKLNFKYKFEEKYNPVYVNGAFGGVNSQGEIVANFYFERMPIPYSEELNINEKGEVIGSEVVDPEVPVAAIRYIETGIIMNLEHARQFHDWLGTHIQRLEHSKGGE
ncbi:DUF3467 domain-containing protein [Bhargavaea cecembensis]|uniref:DUF3467 domain-containing protein n=1 Tax=Bhargavaea cecembensis TaxID=394098 RepID=UPI000590218B|nr:DUF3467 domain-containing protein [Bhargavaea cecembensis]